MNRMAKVLVMDMNEQVILHECINQNKDQFDQLILWYHQSFFKFCYFLTKNQSDADDLYQMTWLKVYQNIEKYNPSYPFKTWLYTVAHNLFKDQMKKKRYMSDVDQIQIGFDDKLDQKLILEQAILNLSEEYRLPIILYYYDGLKMNEISEILNINLSTIKYRIKMAKDLLYQEIEGEKSGT